MSYENDFRMYPLYVHKYWIPHLQDMIYEGLLKKVKISKADGTLPSSIGTTEKRQGY